MNFSINDIVYKKDAETNGIEKIGRIIGESKNYYIVETYNVIKTHCRFTDSPYGHEMRQEVITDNILYRTSKIHKASALNALEIMVNRYHDYFAPLRKVQRV